MNKRLLAEYSLAAAVLAASMLILEARTPGTGPQAAPQGGATGTIIGQVVMADGGQPVSGARAQLARPPSGFAPDAPVGRDAMLAESDATGAFSFPALSPGRYLLSVVGPPGTVCRLSPLLVNVSGGETARVAVQLDRSASVAGRVLVDGQPGGGMLARLLSWGGPILGPRRLQPVFRPGGAAGPTLDGVPTNPRGEFVFADVAPGEYYLMAHELPARAPGRFEARLGVLPAYYPSSSSLAAATPIVVRAGADVRNLEIRLARGKLAQVSGNATDSRGRPLTSGPTSSVALQPASDSEPMPSTSTSVRFGASLSRGRDTGAFLFPDVPPGNYYLVATLLSPEDPGTGVASRTVMTVTAAGERRTQRLWESESGLVRVTVTGSRSVQVDVRTNAGATVSGRVVVEGHAPAGTPGEEPTVVTATAEQQTGRLAQFMRGQRASVRNGTFALQGLRGALVLSAEGPGLVVKSVTRGTEDLTGKAVDYTGAERLTDVIVTLTRDTAALEGIVNGVVTPAAVIVYPEDRAGWRAPLVTAARVSSSEAARQSLSFGGSPPPPASDGARQGYFTASPLLPGRYMVVAVPATRQDGRPLAEWLETLRPQAVPITLAPGDRPRVTLSMAK